MEKEFLQFLMKGGISTNIGPNTKEILLHHAENEYSNGNTTSSIFYQSYALYQALQERYNQAALKYTETNLGKNKRSPIENLMAEMSAREIAEFENNPLMQYVSKSLAKSKTKSNLTSHNSTTLDGCNFLKDVSSSEEGIKKLIEVCQQFPCQWTILQLCKGARTDTTYSVFKKIHEGDAAIYVTLLKHSRSEEYPSPLCLRFSSDKQKKLFESFALIVDRFKQCTKIDPKEVDSRQAKQNYWILLGELNGFIENVCTEFCDFFYPWSFLFTGLPYSVKVQKAAVKRWRKVDEFCDLHQWENDARVLLSLAASNLEALGVSQIEDICAILTSNISEKMEAEEMLKKMHLSKVTEDGQENKHYPCILVIDERLDHFFWEEINVQQEFTRVNSIQSLWRLFHYYKSSIQQGYLCVNITNGGCLLNPDKNLPKMESRMVSFFEYWLPHWKMLVGRRPTEDELFNEYLSCSCYVYSGHGSGLQYINGHNITKHQINCVVFLFGCDSSRLHSSGLYSELVGPHLYYQAAMCPALVGTLMPGLDCNMDKIATEVLSRWIAPKSATVLPWNEIDEKAWTKEYTIKHKKKSLQSVANTPNYNVGSLCGILARVHQRVSEPKLYNTVPYVCRGLPVWNCDVEPLPSKST